MAAETSTGVLPKNYLPGVPLIESPLFNSFFQPQGPNADIYETAKFLNDHGYVVLKNVIPGVENLCDEIKSSLTPEFNVEEWRERKRSGFHRGMRLQDTYDRHASVRKLAASEVVLNLLMVGVTLNS